MRRERVTLVSVVRSCRHPEWARHAVSNEQLC